MFYFKIIPSTFSFGICLFWCKYQLVARCFKIASNKDLEDRVNIIGYLVQTTLLMLRGDKNSNISKRKKKTTPLMLDSKETMTYRSQNMGSSHML